MPTFVKEPKDREKGKVEEHEGRDVEPTFAAYDLSDPEQVKWLRGWFEGRLNALIEHVQTLLNVTGADYLTKRESILEGILDELTELKKLAPHLVIANDSYNPQRIAEDKVAELIEVGLNLKESDYHTYILDNKKDHFFQWNAWLSIAQCLNLESQFREIASAMMQDVVDGRKRDYGYSAFVEEKKRIRAWEQEFGIKLTY